MRVSAGYLERVARDWQSAFEAAHGKTAPPIRWAKGWFRIGDGPLNKGYRRAELEKMTKVLRKGFKDCSANPRRELSGEVMEMILYIGDDYMDQPPTRRHALNRTSPKGQSFIGTCTLCGKPNLTIADMNLECENTRGLTQDEAVLESILGDTRK